MVEQQAHQEGITSPLWGVWLPSLELLSLLPADRDRERLFRASARDGPLLVDVAPFHMSKSTHLFDQRQFVRGNGSRRRSEPTVDFDGGEASIDRSNGIARVKQVSDKACDQSERGALPGMRRAHEGVWRWVHSCLVQVGSKEGEIIVLASQGVGGFALLVVEKGGPGRVVVGHLANREGRKWDEIGHG